MITVLGQTWRGDPWLPPGWSVDPITGTEWEQSFAYKVPYRHRNDKGDVKFVWELNRLQYLHVVAAAARVAGDKDLAALCAAHVLSWIEKNPPLNGVVWASGIELALRLVSFLVVASLLPEAFSPGEAAALAESVATHAYWIDRFPSRFSSANNHRIAELTALSLAGSLMGPSTVSEAWERDGRAGLETEALRQILPDGVGAEQSPTYTAFSLEWLLVASAVGEAVGRPFSDRFLDRVEVAGRHLLGVTATGGHTPRIGDDDEGRVLFDGDDDDYVVSVAAAAAAGRTGRTCNVPAIPRRHLRHALLGEPNLRLGMTAGVSTYPAGGCTAARSVDNGREVLWVLDHGALGYLSIAAHGHADALGVWLHVDGDPVFVDAGTYLYHSGGRWRESFRGTHSHNTLVAGGLDSSTITGPFSWGDRANGRLIEAVVGPEQWRVTAEHDGYVSKFGVRHRRSLDRVGPGAYLITDTLAGSTEARVPVEIGFLLEPAIEAHPTSSGWRLERSGSPLALIDTIGAVVRKQQRGEDSGQRLVLTAVREQDASDPARPRRASSSR